MDQLANEYANERVVFVEQDVDNTVGLRYGRWWTAHDGEGSAMLPIVMVDSGHQISNGYEDFYSVYKSMVDSALSRPPQAEIKAYHQRVDDTLYVYGELTNLSGVSLSSQNSATLHAIIYEDAQIGSTSRFVHAAPWSSIHPALAPRKTMTFTLSATLSGVNWDNIHALALADYRPGEGAYDMLQAAATQTPAVSVQPAQLTFLLDPNDTTQPGTLVSFEGPHILNWTATESPEWVTLSSLSGSVSEQVLVSVSPAALSSGWQNGYITFDASSISGLHFEERVHVRAYYGPLETVYLPILMR